MNETVKYIKENIIKMDAESEDFYEVYKMVADKYHTFKEPDDYQQCVKMIYEWMSRSCTNFEDQVVIVAKVVEQVFLMRAKKQDSCTGTLGFTDTTYYFDIYTTENKKDELNNRLAKTLDSFDKGKATFSGKDKFGKKYFKGKS